MKFEFEIPDEHIKAWVESASCDYVYDRAKQLVSLALDQHIKWQDQVRFDLYDDIKRAVAERLGVSESSDDL